MKKKLLGIFVCTLLIATVLPAVSSMKETTDENGFGCNGYNKADNDCGCSSDGYGLGHIPLPECVERTPLAEPTGTLLTDLDWRNNGGDYTTFAKNQGNCGSCWAFAAMGALEGVINVANSNPTLDMDLSEQYMISCVPSQGSCPNDCVSGGNAYYCFKYIKDDTPPDDGALPESCFPYQAVDANGCDFYGCGFPPVLCSAKCGTWKSQLVAPITGYAYSDTTSGLTPAQIKAKLANGPVCLSMDVYADFNLGPGYSPSFDGNGIYRYDGVSASYGGHAVVCVGYQDSLGCWICKNSWGMGWGNMQGFFKIAYGQCNIENDMSWVSFGTTSNTAPTAFIDSISPSPATQGQAVSFMGHGTDVDGSVVGYDWRSSKDGYLGGSTLVVTSSLSVGTHTISFKVQDNLGAWSPVVTQTLTVNPGNTPPIAVIDSISPSPAMQGQTVTFTGHGTDPDPTDTIAGYNWRSDINGQLSATASFSTSTLSLGTHTIYFKVQDNNGAWSTETSQTLQVSMNSAPTQPTTPTGQSTSCKVNTPYPYSTSASDPDMGDKIKYGWDWTGDSVVDLWDDNGGTYYPSGIITTQITWTSKQTTYSLKVIAEDLQGAQSLWSNPLVVSTPKNKAINTPFLNFLQQYPHLFPLLQQLLQHLRLM